MPLPTTINDLFTSEASNSPGGGESPILADNYLRFHAAFIAQLRDGPGFVTAVRSNALGSVSVPAFSFVGDTNTGAWSPAADTYAISTNGAERLRVDNTGNVGIDCIPAAWGVGGFRVLQLGPIGSIAAADFGGGNTQTVISSNIYFDGTTTRYLTTNIAAQYNQLNGSHTFRTAASGTAGGIVTFVDRLTIAAAGNVTINAPSSGSALTVNGGAVVASATAPWATFGASTAAASFMQFYKGGTTTPVGYIGTDGGALQVGGIGDNFGIRADNSLLFVSGGTIERARIDAAGNLGIGTSAPSAKLHVSGSLRIDAAITSAAAAGAASALPSLPAGYLTVNIGGTDCKIAFYS